ncbi:MAG: diacylglycerol kinase family lipid kinase [Clostridiales bacterium]|nr:diacylglycerol kinase family lipid kinase [Clostridiales bacterium]
MMYIIANKTAGHGLAAKILVEVTNFMKTTGEEFTVLTTDYPGHSTLLAKKAAKDNAKAVFVLGGDGTISEAAQGLAGTGVPMGIIPAGTGNDIIRALNIPKDPLDALKFQLDMKPRKMDIVDANERTFINVAGTGFDVETLIWTEKFRRKLKIRGMIPYFLGLVCTIVTHKDIDIELTLDGNTRQIRALILTVANGSWFGGGMHVAKDARVDDGLLDVMLIHPIPKWKIPFLLPAFLTGEVAKYSFVELTRCKKVSVKRKGQIINLDGELHNIDSMDFSVRPGQITLMR